MLLMKKKRARKKKERKKEKEGLNRYSSFSVQLLHLDISYITALMCDDLFLTVYTHLDGF